MRWDGKWVVLALIAAALATTLIGRTFFGQAEEDLSPTRLAELLALPLPAGEGRSFFYNNLVFARFQLQPGEFERWREQLQVEFKPDFRPPGMELKLDRPWWQAPTAEKFSGAVSGDVSLGVTTAGDSKVDLYLFRKLPAADSHL